MQSNRVVALVFYTKLLRKWAVSQTVFFIASGELIKKRRARKYGTIAQDYFVSQMLLVISMMITRGR